LTAPTGGVIRLDPHGEPDGVFEETAMALPQAALPLQSSDDRVRAIEFGARRYAELGITTAQHGFCNADELRDFDRAFQERRVPIRVVVWPGLRVMRMLDAGELAVETSPDRLTVGAVKLFADGSIQGYTGHLCHPYHVPFRGDREYRGYAAMPREKLAQRVSEIYAAGHQVAVHVNGDAAIDDFLYAVEVANERFPRTDARPIAVHAQMTREDQLETMHRLGVVPSFFSLHTYYWGDRHREVFIGPERAGRISPTRSARNRGVRFTIHTDAPVVPMNPLLLLWSAIHRRTSSGRELGAEQRISPDEALRATTIDAAWQLFEESERGSIEVGKLADFAVLDTDPCEQPEALREARVTATYVSGAQV
jgi:predicted amidohydrolase YtcJ